MSQAAAMLCMPLPTKKMPPQIHRPRNAGWRKGLHKEVECWDMEGGRWVCVGRCGTWGARVRRGRVAQGGFEDIAGSPFWGNSILQTPSIHMPPAPQPVGARHVGAGGDQRLGTLLHVGQGLVQPSHRLGTEARK